MPSGPHKRAALRKKKQRQHQHQQQQQQDRCHSKSGADQDDAGSVEEEEEEEGLVSPGTPVTDRESPMVPLPSPLADTETAAWVGDSTPTPSDGTNQQEHIQVQEQEEDKRQEEEEQHRQAGEQEKGGQALLKPQPAAGCSCGIVDWLLGRE